MSEQHRNRQAARKATPLTVVASPKADLRELSVDATAARQAKLERTELRSLPLTARSQSKQFGAEVRNALQQAHGALRTLRGGSKP